MNKLIKKSIAAAILIGLGNIVLLKVGQPIGPFLFSFGLLGVCECQLNLFTGKCGFLFEDDIPYKDLCIILVCNLLAGYLFGYLCSLQDPEMIQKALDKVNTWNLNINFFIKSICCGIIMYLAVYLYRKGTKLGILLGVPLFIFAGFQHCIANIITLGVAHTFSITLVVCIIGNFLGSLFIWYLTS